MINVIRRKSSPSYRRCAFTGYRLQKMPFGFNETDPRCIDFKCRLYDTIEMMIEEGYFHFISGGALGMDLYAAEVVLSLQSKYPWVILEMVSPFDGQSDRWPVEYKFRWAKLFASADIVTATGHNYTKSCMAVRNRYLVNNADVVLAAFDGKPGGTASTISYAKAQGIPVRIIEPERKMA